MYSTAMMQLNPPFVNPINFRKHFPHHVPSYRPSLILKCCSTQDEDSDRSKLGFSVLKHRFKTNSFESDRGTVYSTMALYVFSLHVPLSFGGLAAVANLVHQNPLQPELVAPSLLALQTSELILVFTLLMKPRYDVIDFFRTTYPRNWLFASAIGFLSILCSVFVTSIVGDSFLGFEEVHDPSILQQLLSSGPVSATACVLVYCIVTPLLEELVYRGYLLTSLSSSMKWYHAVLLSSLMFSAVHFSAENSVPLFAVGCVLGGSYCWTGSLTSPILIHSLYNAFTLFAAYFY